METVKPIHRTTIFMPKYSEEEYWAAVLLFKEILVGNLGKLLYSLVLCGSLAKKTLTPGWSDIDVVIVIHSDTNTIDLSVYQLIAESIKAVNQKYNIPVGVDLITNSELPKNNIVPKILGRPTNLTYQMQLYSKVIYGEQILNNIPRRNQLLVDLEEYFAILANIHNYRRVCCQTAIVENGRQLFINLIHTGIKSTFKIAESYSNLCQGTKVGYDNIVLNLKGYMPDKEHDLLNRLAKIIKNFDDLEKMNDTELEQLLRDIIILIDFFSEHIRKKLKNRISQIVDRLSTYMSPYESV